jgi:hypothetical protein
MKKEALLLFCLSAAEAGRTEGRERKEQKEEEEGAAAICLSWARPKEKALLLFCTSAAEAGRISDCRGETPRTPPTAGEVAHGPSPPLLLAMS